MQSSDWKLLRVAWQGWHVSLSPHSFELVSCLLCRQLAQVRYFKWDGILPAVVATKKQNKKGKAVVEVISAWIAQHFIAGNSCALRVQPRLSQIVACSHKCPLCLARACECVSCAAAEVFARTNSFWKFNLRYLGIAFLYLVFSFDWPVFLHFALGYLSSCKPTWSIVITVQRYLAFTSIPTYAFVYDIGKLVKCVLMAL